jgi:hypothetical protein
MNGDKFEVGDIIEYCYENCKPWCGSIGIVRGGPYHRKGYTCYRIAWVILNEPFAYLSEPKDQFVVETIRKFTGTSDAPADRIPPGESTSSPASDTQT